MFLSTACNWNNVILYIFVFPVDFKCLEQKDKVPFITISQGSSTEESPIYVTEWGF